MNPLSQKTSKMTSYPRNYSDNLLLVSQCVLKETVKTIVLEQDPLYHKKDGGLFQYPPSPTTKDGVLVA